MDEIAVDTRVFAFSLLISLLTGMVCGLAPGIGARRGNVARALRATGAGAIDRRRQGLRHALVVAQVGLAIVLLVAAGLMVGTLTALNALDLGFDPRNVLTFGVDLSGDRYRLLASTRDFGRDLVTRLELLPGVNSAGVGSVPLLASLRNSFWIENQNEPIESMMDVPSPGYFPALRLRLVSGRLFDDDDHQGNIAVAIVNRAFARRAWGADQAVGQRLWLDERRTRAVRIVGVIEDLRMASLEAEPPPIAYIPFAQSTTATFRNYVVRSTGDPRAVIGQVRDTVRAIDPAIPLTRIASMDERIARALAPKTFILWLFGLFSIVALALSLVGLYALMSEAVASRTPEIGIRMALGARRGEVIRVIMGRSLITTAVGMGLGLAAAVGLTRYLEGMLFGLPALDPITFSAVPVAFTLTALLAALIPARRATTVDPVIALRCE